ncbi:uncharacterized protein FTOL_11920 [Fusarium torulosum]|uniref:F-box domain-containing protein n=1 Tax=Fusarium torulosum TaxID=33205 RepID=A0AAE8MJP3_9HYPO|nr:uncharacterized protein FTOL_11920 [Fusarium torulosum]
MGYSEVYCHICGVSFNINRFRTIKEPRSASRGVDPDDYTFEECAEQKTCYFFQRRPGDPEPTGDIGPEFAASSSKSFLDSIQSAEPDVDGGAWEHVPGPDCANESAYNGNSISVEAMKGCKVLQCLVRKPDDWQPEPDDEPFEISGTLFLSGLSDNMPSRDMSYPQVFPKRHGEMYPAAENCMWENERTEEYAMPFHPTCFEIFKRASIHRYGAVDIECIMKWWELEPSYEDFHSFPRHPDVKMAQEQWWQHNQGDEYLAANPCFVPGLESILSSTQHLQKVDKNYSGLTPTSILPKRTPMDPFSRLPAEIRLSILSLLAFKDIANLRLTSRVFLQLPQSLFHQLTIRNTPWLYEAWSSLPLSFWAITTPAELEKHPELLRLPRPTTSVTSLDLTKTDWFHLQTEISRNWQHLLGLQNRRRIWKDCEEILDRVDLYRKQCKIKPRSTVVVR